MSFIYRLSLWLLFGWCIWTDSLYASNNQETSGDHLKVVCANIPRGQMELLLAAAVDKDMVTFYSGLAKLKKEMSEGISEELQKALDYLLDEENAEEIYQWVCANYLTRSELSKCFQEYINKSFLSDYQFPLSFLRKETDPQKIQDYLKNLPKELENSQEELKNYCNHIIYQTGGLKHLQKFLILAIQERLQKQAEYLKKGVNSDPYFLGTDNSATYSAILGAVDKVAADMEPFFKNIIAAVETQETNFVLTAKDYMLEIKKHTTSSSIVAAIKELGTNIKCQAQQTSKYQMRQSLYTLYLYIDYICSMPENGTRLLSREQVKQIFDVLKTVDASIRTGNKYPTTKAGNPDLSMSSNYIRYYAHTLGAISSMALYSCHLSFKNSLEKVFSQDKLGNLSGKRQSRPFGKKAVVVAAALVVAAAGYQLYNKYFAQEKKATAIPAGPSSSQKNWLFFILCLLLGGLLIIGFFYRKKTPRA